MKYFLLPVLLIAIHAVAVAGADERPLRIAVLDLGDSISGARVAERLVQGFNQSRDSVNGFQMVDRDRVRAAAIGIGYQGSLNLTLSEARDLGSAIGCDFFLTGSAATVRRSPAEGTAYFESYAALYLVSARTGQLILWERFSVRQAKAEEAEKMLLEKVAGSAAIQRYQKEFHRSAETESAARAQALERPAAIIEDAPDDSAPAADGLRLPRPYRQLRPPTPQVAVEAEIEATVDVMVDIDAQGEISRVQIARWAGYELDQSVIDTVKRLHFFPAMRDGVAVPLRVLLRYNFRKPSKENSSG